MQTNKKETDQGKVFSAEEVLRRNMSVAFDDEANQPFLAEMIKCMELYANHSQYKEITLPSQPVKEESSFEQLVIAQIIYSFNKYTGTNEAIQDAAYYINALHEQLLKQHPKEDKESVLTDEQPI